MAEKSGFFDAVSLLVRLRVEIKKTTKKIQKTIVSLLVRLRVEIRHMRHRLITVSVSLLVRLRVEMMGMIIQHYHKSSQPPREAAS